MAVKTYAKPAVRNAWADDPPNGASDFVDPGNTYADAGWQVGVKPPRQYFNWVLWYASAAVRYFCQQGIADWDTNEVYPLNGIAQGTDNNLYQSKIANNSGINPVGDNGTHWGPVQGVAPAASDNSNSLATTAWINTNFLPQGSTFAAIAGQLANAQLAQSNITQFQGALSIGGGQITSAVAEANTILSIGAGAAQFNWSGQSGQPTYVWGANSGTEFYPYNPSNFSVANSAKLAGLSPSTAPGGGTIVERDASGYIYGVYFNQSSANNEDPTISQVIVTNGTDNFFRKAGLAALGLALSQPQFFSNPGYARLPGGLILQWGRVSTSWATLPLDVAVTFPETFPNGCLFGISTSWRSVGSYGEAVDGSGYAYNLEPTGMTITVDASTGMWLALGY